LENMAQGINKSPAFIIDRDGVINRMVNYSGQWDSPQKPKDVRLVDGIVDILHWLNERHIPIIEISNQPGIAKGKMTQETSDAIENRVHQLLASRGVRIDKTYICPHHPKGVVPELTRECDCRKPKAGLFIKAAKDLGINFSESVMLGDKASDIQAGDAVGCKTVLYLHNEDQPEKIEQTKRARADHQVTRVQEVLEILPKIFKLV